MSTRSSTVSLSITTKPNTISVLTTYAFPKLYQYYTSKGKTCVLEQYQNEMIEYFIHNKLNLKQFYTSSITKNNFISSVIKYIDNKNGTQNDKNYALQTAIKRLYTILQLHKHAITCQPMYNTNIENIMNNMSPVVSPRSKTRSVTDIKKRERERMDAIYQLSAAQSELSSLQQTVNSLQNMTSEAQEKLQISKQNEQKYKQTVNKLQKQLNTEKTQVSSIMTANKELTNINKQLLSELNENKEQFLSVNEQLKKNCEYLKMISNLKTELETKQKQLHEINAYEMGAGSSFRKDLTLGSNLDCLNESEFVWWPATVIDIDLNNNKIKIRYDTFAFNNNNNNNNIKSDEWINKSSTRIAPYMSKAKDVVDIDVMTENINQLKVVGKSRQNLKIYKQGFLVKQNLGLFKSYKTNYFRLFEHGFMCGYKTMTDKTIIVKFNISQMIETRKIKFPKNAQLFGFEIVCIGNIIHRFQTDSDQICTEWIDIIHALAQDLEELENSIEVTCSDEIVSSFSGTDEMKELKLKDIKLNSSNSSNKSNDENNNIEHTGWMYNQGILDTNWMYRYWVLYKQPLTLKCYFGPDSKNETCPLPENSQKFSQLEIPTMFAFHLVTESRIYTFSCKSKLDINLWITKIKMFCVFDVTMRNKSENELNLKQRRPSIVQFGNSLNKLATSFGRLIGVTQEHVTTTQVVEKKCNSPNIAINNNNNDMIKRRSSVPVISKWNNNNFIQKDGFGRRRSAPYLPGLSGLGNGSSMWYNQQKQKEKCKVNKKIDEEVIECKNDNNNDEIDMDTLVKMNIKMNNDSDDDSELSELDEYD